MASTIAPVSTAASVGLPCAQQGSVEVVENRWRHGCRFLWRIDLAVVV